MDALKEFVIVAPPYSRSSAGIICLHELCDALIEQGFRCHIVLLDASTPSWSYHYNSDGSCFNPALRRTTIAAIDPLVAISEVIKFGITIYPEIVVGNPLNATNVVRYFLNYDGAMTGIPSQYSSSDFRLVYSPMYLENYHAILHRPITNALFNAENAPHHSQRRLNATYFGKGKSFINCVTIENSIQISAEWPSTKQELATLLRNTRYLFSYDNLTSINLDATLCGAVVVLLQDIQFERSLLRSIDNGYGPLPFVNGVVLEDTVTLDETDISQDEIGKFKSSFANFLINWNGHLEDVVAMIFSHFCIS